jgi:hypothetical protein
MYTTTEAKAKGVRDTQTAKVISSVLVRWNFLSIVRAGSLKRAAGMKR